MAVRLLSRSRRTLVQLPLHRSSFRHVSDAPSDLSDEQMVKDTSAFVRWNNGGGLFHRSARIDPTAVVEVGAVVHSDSVLGSDVRIGSGTVVGPSVSIGQSTKVGYNAVLSNCSVGQFSTIHNGVCVGQDGFGFFMNEEGHILKKPQLMRTVCSRNKYCSNSMSHLCSFHFLKALHVRIGDNVEIGANTCIDRGSWRDTVVGDHTKIDNLVQIGHNVIIGKCCMLCGQVGIAGSVTLGDYVTLGGRVAIRDHVSIASKVRLAANSCVTKDLAESGDYGGFPAVPIHEWRRQSAKLRRLCKNSP
ncbi:hypothetical protein C4D60_Mb02t03310 [Musa balbisiana]|uniref:UDP-3-O-[3-hydroxymyristoyl] glucosamine N-acyltransferase non-repeat region domain-containing protein n=1 Tax=Musa balbisiana TaxID=52838 RepID=A0A4S8I7X6_MUSBA|nr:hypothetical protein C4D60_Mb02t03310 [Musa balbisiana]